MVIGLYGCKEKEPEQPPVHKEPVEQTVPTERVLSEESIPLVDGAEDLDLIPGGTFEMGESFQDREPDERPVHSVKLFSFYMSRHEITNGEYSAFLNSAYPAQLKVVSGIVYALSDTANNYPYCTTSSASSGSPNSGEYSQISFSDSTFSVQPKGNRDMSNDPMVMVSWYGAVAYCNWQTRRGGKEPCYILSKWKCDFTKNGYRLPTEAEWEYAARGGLAGKRFPWGDTVNHSRANYRANGDAYSFDTSPYTTWTFHRTWNDKIYPYTCPKSSFSPNGYDLSEMTGNVWEWCNDWYESNYYSYSPQSNPTGPMTWRYRVLRGGSWYYDALDCRVASRHHDSPANRSRDIGFRICCSK